MAAADYHLCDLCGAKAFYDANIGDPYYVATYAPSADAEPIGIAVLCWQCNKTHEAVIRPREPAPSPWRPIETAPKDGTQFLTWDSHYGIRVGRCVVRPDHDDWLSYMDAYKGSSKGGIRATHWMPLPLAPKEVE